MTERASENILWYANQSRKCGLAPELHLSSLTVCGNPLQWRVPLDSVAACTFFVRK
jgi:hypothetical protein